MIYERVVEGIYYVGDSSTHLGLDCNPYLLIDGDEAVLFDPGSIMDFHEVLKTVEGLIDLDKIKYIVLHHEDPDFCGSVTEFEKMGVKASIVTTWRTMTLIQYYGIRSPYYLLEEHDHMLKMASGRRIKFILTPYLHFAGAFVSYDIQTKSLFSSDLFGAFSYNRTLYADNAYMGKMLTFHEHYMPSNAVLRPVMDVLLKYSIDRILPQHGSIIREGVEDYIYALRTLECGILLNPIKKDLLDSGGYVMIFNDVLQRYETLYPHHEVQSVFERVEGLIFNERFEVKDYFGEPKLIWNLLFNEIKVQKGMLWITVVEPFVRGLVAIYNIPLPHLMENALQTAVLENQQLIEQNLALENTLHTVNDKLTKCEITGLYNEVFFKSYMLNELELEDWRDIGALAFIGIDNFSSYQLKYGTEAVNAALNNIVYLLKEHFFMQSLFKLDTADFGIYIKGSNRETIVESMEAIRLAIGKSEVFLGNLTVSIGIVFPDELILDAASYDLALFDYLERGIKRLRKAKVLGKNCVCFEGEADLESHKQGGVLIVDSDETNLEIIRTFVSELGIEVYTAMDGIEGLEIAHLKEPIMVISEINLPKLDGFLLREALLTQSKTKQIETVFLSYQKDEDSVLRAVNLGVSHYMKKPYMLSELMGIIKRRIKVMTL